eukprot:2901734-Pyramimonas_sp.AAC.1
MCIRDRSLSEQLVDKYLSSPGPSIKIPFEKLWESANMFVNVKEGAASSSTPVKRKDLPMVGASPPDPKKPKLESMDVCSD